VTNLVREIQVKSVLSAQRRTGSLPFDFSINPYRGCLFGCSYCYASKFVYDDDARKADWGHWVDVKANAVDALQRESARLYDKSVFISSATDPYQPIERRLELTRAILEALLFCFPRRVHIQTRSPLVVRDVDLFRRFGPTVQVGISIPTDSDVVRRAFEPRAPAIFRRQKAARELREAGIRTVASVSPVMPCTPERLARIAARCFDDYWVDGLNFYEKAVPLRALYKEHGWERYIGSEHVDAVRAALASAFGDGPPATASPGNHNRILITGP
jgi:DNA repair photolyase